MIERVDKLTEPLVAGQHYLVWTVTAKWNNLIRAWPVIGPKHDDKEFFNFKREHYHVDSRFLPLKAKYRGETLSHPLHAHLERWGSPAVPLTDPTLRRRKCISVESEIWVPERADPRPLTEMHKHYIGHQCVRGKAGWICPHRKASLGSIQPIDGVITCPLHLLKIDAATGIVLA